MIPVVWLTYREGERPRDKWDAVMLEALFANRLWAPVGAQSFEHFDSISEATLHGCGGDCYWAGQPGHGGGAVVVFPAGIHREQYDRLNEELARLEWVLLILTADEGSLFEAKHVHHPNLILWVMTPRPGYTYPTGTRFIGEGFHPRTREVLAVADDTKTTPAWFSGQVTHPKRKAMVDALAGRADINETTGFARGLEPVDYLLQLAATKVTPCPSGPVTPDSFRLYESLEAGCLPIADDVSPDYDTPGYWDMVLPGHPFPTIETDGWADTLSMALNDWPGNANHTFGWWQAHKRDMAYWLVDDLETLGAPAPHGGDYRDQITALVCTSPIPSHPSTEIIEQTVASIRERLPDVEIILGIDGIDPKAEEKWLREDPENTRRADYDEYTRRLLWLCNHKWTNVLPIVHGPHCHQSGMAAAALELVRTPFVFYVEGDLPVCGEIPFDGFMACLADGTADLIRLTLNTTLEPTHMHLMLDDGTTQYHNGVPLTKTVQWSQQPHLATTNYYRSIMQQYFRSGEATYLEWRMHSVCAGEWHKNGPLAWFRNRLWIYTPEGNMCRVIHLDGHGDVFDDQGRQLR